MSYLPDLEWFLSGVAAHMLTQIKALLEALRAVGAEIPLHSCLALSCGLLALSCCLLALSCCLLALSCCLLTISCSMLALRC